MKTLIFVLIIASLLQSAILSLDLVLIILICRAYLRSDKSNLYLAFAFGLLLSHLNLSLFGLQSIIYLIIVQLTQVLARLRLAGNPAVVMPISLFFLSINQILNTAPLFPYSLIGAVLSLPVFYLIRFWEEGSYEKKTVLRF